MLQISERFSYNIRREQFSQNSSGNRFEVHTGDNMQAQEESFGNALVEYLPRLIYLAERNMSRRLQTRIGADDLAHSVVKSVFRRFREGKLIANFEDDGQFWKFLVVVALNKIRKKARDHGSKKRNLSLDQPLSELEFLIEESRDPSDEEAEQVADVLERLEEVLSNDGKILLQCKMDGLTNRQIAEKLNSGQGVSTKTVTRRWNEIIEQLRSIIEEMDLG
jgi:RNA polymerase sigma factor (sigma-70 family)